MEDARAYDQTCRYAAGLPHRDTRPLADDDRRWLERRLTRLAVELAAALVGITAIMGGAMALADRAPHLATMLRGGWGMGLLALGGAGVLACLTSRGWWRGLALAGASSVGAVLAADAWLPTARPPRWLVAEVLLGTTVLGLSFVGLGLARRARLLYRSSRIRADLAAGTLEVFEGTRADEGLDGSLARLCEANGLPAHAPVRLEVLPRSGVMVRLGGHRIERWEAAHMVDVAPAQPHALRVELPRGVAPAQPDPRLYLRRRSLTPHERAEIERHIAHLRRRWWPVVVFTVGVLALVAWDLRTASPEETIPLGGASLGWLALLVVVYVGYGRRMLAARKLEHDRRLRWVVTVHQDAADPHQDPPSLEVLPISQLAWTERAAPAGWRLSRL